MTKLRIDVWTEQVFVAVFTGSWMFVQVCGVLSEESEVKIGFHEGSDLCHFYSF